MPSATESCSFLVCKHPKLASLSASLCRSLHCSPKTCPGCMAYGLESSNRNVLIRRIVLVWVIYRLCNTEVLQVWKFRSSLPVWEALCPSSFPSKRSNQNAATGQLTQSDSNFERFKSRIELSDNIQKELGARSSSLRFFIDTLGLGGFQFCFIECVLALF